MPIVKVQIALEPPDHPALVYAEGHRMVQQQELGDDVLAALGGDVKGYFEAQYRRGKWVIGRRVEAQPW